MFAKFGVRLNVRLDWPYARIASHSSPCARVRRGSRPGRDLRKPHCLTPMHSVASWAVAACSHVQPCARHLNCLTAPAGGYAPCARAAKMSRSAIVPWPNTHARRRMVACRFAGHRHRHGYEHGLTGGGLEKFTGIGAPPATLADSPSAMQDAAPFARCLETYARLPWPNAAFAALAGMFRQCLRARESGAPRLSRHRPHYHARVDAGVAAAARRRPPNVRFWG